MEELQIENIKAKDIMTQDIVSACKEDELSKVLGKMREKGIHELPVVEDNTLVGLLSYDNLIKRRNLPLTTKVEHVMTFPPKISEEDTMTKVAECMLSSGYRALPITSKGRLTKGKLVGMISRTDLIKVIPRIPEISSTSVSQVMTPNPLCVSENETITKAKHLMRSLDERTIPVVDSSRKLLGVVGLKDIANFLWRPIGKETKGEIAGEKKPVEIAIKSVMRTPAISVSPSAAIKEAVNLMNSNNISTVVVVENETPVGILRQRDLITLIASFRKKEGVYIQITGLEEEDPSVYDSMYAMIQKSMQKICKIYMPQILTLHIVQHNREGEVSKWSIRARLSTSKKMFYAKAFDWDLMRALDELLTELERMITREKERQLEERKHPKIEI